MKIFTPALGWFIMGSIIMFFGLTGLAALETANTSSYYSDDGEGKAMLAWALIGFGALAAMVGVIAKGVEVGIKGSRDD